MFKNIAIGVLAAALAYDSAVHILNRKKFEQQKERNAKLVKLLKNEIDYSKYLLTRLDENEIPVTEFDRIVAHYLPE